MIPRDVIDTYDTYLANPLLHVDWRDNDPPLDAPSSKQLQADWLSNDDSLSSDWLLLDGGSAGGVGSEGAGEGTSEEACKLYTFVVYVVVFGSLCVVGLVGNTLAFAVLQRDHSHESRPATFLLQVRAARR